MDAPSGLTTTMPVTHWRQRQSPLQDGGAREVAAVLDRCRHAYREVEAARLVLAQFARLRGPIA